MKNPLVVLAAFVVALCFAGVPLAQNSPAGPAPAATTPAPTPAAATPPPLGTAERVAIGSLEQKKSDARQTWNDAAREESLIEHDWAAAHPGWHIDSDAIQQGMLRVVPDTKPNAPPPPAPTKAEPSGKK
jgi:hypothetical protein